MGALERDEWLRAAWRAMVSESVEPERFVFVDEMGANISLSVVRAWSRRGERAYCSVPRNRGKNTTLLASMSVEGMGPSLAVEGATTATVFEAYVEKALAPTLRPGQIVVMDNLSAHKGARVRELVEERGSELVHLPPYSPDMNPIERRPSPRSRASCARQGPGAGRLWWKRWARRSMRSRLRTREASSSTAGTGHRVNRYDRRCSAKAKAEQTEGEIDVVRRERILPDDKTLEKICRYEAHLSRQLYHALHELENLQKHRTTGEGVPLARLDVQGLPE